MKNFVGRIMQGVKEFSVVDFAVWKTALVLLGAGIGASRAEKIKPYLPVLWLIYAAAFVYTIYRTFRETENTYQR
ncbi:hypothetical protein C6I21_11430 [Alkalicoccus urumqiensis]|uniref:Uncharacterized protein n=2 Tax=Alkalicoccus urumqiensis TaxID=1548213 RepID=A0A2P6MFM6_ALKUR|nr:hypothetical protein C6I21_11430 [Alkalicoccus urumqiensis]